MSAHTPRRRRRIIRMLAPAIVLAFTLTARPLVTSARAADKSDHAARPNIVFILADDMGYGDPKCFNPQSQCATPNIDRLAHDGIRFTDAHSAGATCIPSRYGLVTGRYPFRAASMDPTKTALVNDGQITIASLLHSRGYATAMIGKWHLGFKGGMPFDYQHMRGGPVDHGFDSFFGQHASLDIPPYFYIENDHAASAPTGHIDTNHSPDWSPIQGAFYRGGPIAEDFKLDQVLPTYIHHATDYIRDHAHAADGKPFFLYLAMTAPHTPWLPSEEFRSRSAGNLYAAWVTQVDAAVGRVLAALDQAGVTDHTLVFFASDNGPVWYPQDVTKYHHAAAGPLRGMKGDVWEGGHREPLIARWPHHITPGSTSKRIVCFTDMLATFADASGQPLPEDSPTDSFSILPEMTGAKRTRPARSEMIIERGRRRCIRRGDWMLIPFLGSGGFTHPSFRKPKPGEPAGQLYNLADDIGETHNVYTAHSDIVKQLEADMEKIDAAGRSGD